MIRIVLLYVSVLLVLGLVSCVKNDLPYPYQKADILEMEVEGQLGSALIDPVQRTIQLSVNDTVDVQQLKVLRMVFTPGAVLSPDSGVCVNPIAFPSFGFSIDTLAGQVDTRINVEQPARFVLHTYQEYAWTINVVQEFDRNISVQGQVGKALVDENNRTILIFVSKQQKLDVLQVYQMQLGGSTGIVTPSPDTISDYRLPRQFTVTRLGKYVEQWVVIVAQTSATTTTGATDAWAHKAIVSGGVQQGVVPVIEYKKKSSQVWAQLPEGAVSVNNNVFMATIIGLQDGTEYVWRAVVGDKPGSETTFVTEKIVEVPNLGFDNWTLGDNDRCWYPSEAKANDYWATGNEGITSSLAGSMSSNTTPDESPLRGRAARLETFGDVPMVGVAAGNLLVGTYKTDGLRPANSVKMGRPFTGARPTKLRGWYRYVTKPINYPSTPTGVQNDSCHIYIWIKDAQGTQIAYGELSNDRVMRSFEQFEIAIKYTDVPAKPASIAIVATSSRYGGVFTGAKVTGAVGVGSVLWVDEFELIYD